MKTSKLLRTYLLLSGLIAAGIGAVLLLDPATLMASNGIELGTDPSRLSEVRAPGGALMAFGLLIAAGAFARRLATTATAVSAVLYSAYGASRLVGIALDGMPAPGLVQATAFELGLGALGLLALWLRARAGSDPATSAAPEPARSALSA